MQTKGQAVTGYLNNAEAGPTIIPMAIMGTTTTRALGSTEYLNITDLTLSVGSTAELASVICDATGTGAGKTVVEGFYPINGGSVHDFGTAFKGPRGVAAYLFSVGDNAHTVTFNGYITEA